MTLLTITEHFEKKLGAPFVNPRFSWGAKAEDGTVYLRAWTHEIHTIDGHRYAEIQWPKPPDTKGWSERNDHIEMLKSGAPVRIVYCVGHMTPSANGKSEHMKITDYFDEYVSELLPELYTDESTGILMAKIGQRIYLGESK